MSVLYDACVSVLADAGIKSTKLEQCLCITVSVIIILFSFLFSCLFFFKIFRLKFTVFFSEFEFLSYVQI